MIVVGGGAAGFFAAVTAAEANTRLRVTILEQGARFLQKVRISGGGRCNVTHACFDPLELSGCYPRGGKALIGPFHRFQPRATVEWFETRGVRLKTEPDGRMFPVTDSSQTVVDCLLGAARAAGVQMRTGCRVERVTRTEDGRFALALPAGEPVSCDRLLLALGGCRTPAVGALAAALGHTLEPPVPSLFAFEAHQPWLGQPLPGIAVDPAEVWVPGTALRERGAVLITHQGLSGPAILRLSAWGARTLHDRNYTFTLKVNWIPHLTAAEVTAELDQRRQSHGRRQLGSMPVGALPGRLWQQLVLAAGLNPTTQGSSLTRRAQQRLEEQLQGSEIRITGKSLNRDEFVTCGGIPLKEVNFKTMESRVCAGLYLAGEFLDIDAITGGYNFQAAWTTGWTAGCAMAAEPA